MSLQSAKLIPSLFLAVTLTSSLACQKEEKPVQTQSVTGSMTGGHDGGGGQTLQSTEAEVHAALDRALELAHEPDYRYNVFTQWQWARLWWVHEQSTDENLEIFNLGCRVVAGTEAEKACREFTGKPKDKNYGTGIRPLRAFMTKGYFSETLKKSPLRRTDGDCRIENGSHADASVNAFTVGAEICFSIKQLRRLPASALLREILGLLFHELAHLNAVDEKHAQLLQSAFTEFFIKRFGQADRETFLRESNRKLVNAHDSVTIGSSQNLKIYQLSEVLQSLESLPFYWDPTAIQIHLGTKDLKAAMAYSYSVMNLIIQYSEQIRKLSEAGHSKPFLSSKKAEQEVSQLIGNYNHLAGQDGVKINIREVTREGSVDSLHPWLPPMCPEPPKLAVLIEPRAAAQLNFRIYQSQVIGWMFSNEYNDLPKCQ